VAAIAISSLDRGPAVADPPAHLEPADVLSPSQIACFSQCAAKWYYKYALNLKERPNSNLTLGTSVHAGIAHAMQWKVETGKYPDPDCVTGIYNLAWSEQSDETEFREDESPGEIRTAGESLIRKYMAEAAPRIKPAQVEIEVSGLIAGVPVRGRIDVLEENGTIRDLKTAARKPEPEITGRNAMQLAIYAAITPGASGQVAIDTLVKTKTPQLVQIEQKLDAEDRRAPELQLPVIRDAMRSGYYAPNRDALTCSRRNCGYWRECQSEFGGKVAAS
jgi:putative RecB family exonuclease